VRPLPLDLEALLSDGVNLDIVSGKVISNDREHELGVGNKSVVHKVPAAGPVAFQVVFPHGCRRSNSQGREVEAKADSTGYRLFISP